MTINVFNEIDKIFTAAAPKHTFSRTEWAQCLECGKAVSWCETLTKCHICGNELVKVPDYETGERLYLERKRAELQLGAISNIELEKIRAMTTAMEWIDKAMQRQDSDYSDVAHPDVEQSEAANWPDLECIKCGATTSEPYARDWYVQNNGETNLCPACFSVGE